MSSDKQGGDGLTFETVWYVVNHDRDDAIVRGPYPDSATAAAVRRELERHMFWAEKNLWIVPADQVVASPVSPALKGETR